MQFVWIKHPKVESPARVPVSALPHWTGHGWVETDPPVKPARPPRRRAVRVRAPRPPVPPVKSTPVDPPTGKSPVKTPKAPHERKED